MVEAYDAANNRGLLQAYTTLLALIGAGALIEFVALPLLRKFVARREWFFAEVGLRAIRGQALFWGVALGLLASLANVIPNLRLAALALSFLNLLAVLAATLFLVRIVTNTIRLYFVRHTIGSISLLDNVLRGFTASVLITTALASLGVPIGPLLTILAGSSIGLSLALREPLANLFSGLTVLASNKIQPGDYIRLSTGEEGFVSDIRWSDTYIRELTNNLVVVPNALMTTTILTNFHRPEPDMLIIFPMGVPYHSDLAAVERMVKAVAHEVQADTPGGVADFEPLVRYNAFGDTGVQFNIILRVQSFTDQFVVRHEFTKRLNERFTAEGLPPPIPARVVRVAGAPPPYGDPAPERGPEQPVAPPTA